MSKRSAQDRHEEISNRVRWAKAMCDVMIGDRDLQEIHTEAIADIGGHLANLADAMRRLEELYGDLPHEVPEPKVPQKPRIVPIRKSAPADNEPEHAQ